MVLASSGVAVAPQATMLVTMTGHAPCWRLTVAMRSRSWHRPQRVSTRSLPCPSGSVTGLAGGKLAPGPRLSDEIVHDFVDLRRRQLRATQHHVVDVDPPARRRHRGSWRWCRDNGIANMLPRRCRARRRAATDWHFAHGLARLTATIASARKPDNTIRMIKPSGCAGRRANRPDAIPTPRQCLRA